MVSFPRCGIIASPWRSSGDAWSAVASEVPLSGGGDSGVLGFDDGRRT